MIYYGIKLVEKNKLLGFDYSKIDEDENSVGVEFTLCEFADNVWLTPYYEKALRVLKEPVEWYNADYDWPQLPYGYKKDKYTFEVVQVNLEVSRI